MRAPRNRPAGASAGRCGALLRAVAVAGAAGSFVVLAAGTDTRSLHGCRDCNVVLISADTVRADHVGAYGYARPTTPNIDRFAASSVLFENAFSQSSWTRPAHLSMFTGLYPAEHGVVALMHRARLPDSVPTVASVLRKRGYATGGFTGGVNVDADFGFDQGFDTYRTNGKNFRDNLEETLRWLDEHRDRKFFLFSHGYDAHTPYLTDPIDRVALGLPDHIPRRSFRRLCNREDGSPTRILPYVAEYDASIHRADRYVGKLLARLDELGLADRTVVVVTSDHGEEFLEHGGCFHLNTLHREVLHVPLVIRAPGLRAQRRTELVPASVSIAATILDLVGIADHPLPGPSLVPMLFGGSPPPPQVVSETMRRADRRRGQGHVRALQTDDAKLISWITQERRAYFDLARDRAEQQPVESGPDVERLQRLLTAWLEQHPPNAPADARPASASTSPGDDHLDEQLRSLGYLD